MRAAAFYLLLAFLVIPSLASANTKPLMLRNSHPLMLVAPSARFERMPSDKPEAALGLGYSSTFLMARSRRYDVAIDIETAVAELELAMPIGGKSAIGLVLPVVGYQSGNLDRPLGSYHDALGTPDYGRSARPDNSFLLSMSRDGKKLINGSAGRFEPADPRISLRREVFRRDAHLAGACVFVEPPVGDPSLGMGNGSWDMGASFAYEGMLTEFLGIFGQAGYIMPGRFRGHAETITLKDIPYAGAGLSYELSGSTALVVQAMAQGSAWNTGIRAVDSASVLGAVGLRRTFAEGLEAEAYIAEDINTAGAPDFILGVAVRKGL